MKKIIYIFLPLIMFSCTKVDENKADKKIVKDVDSDHITFIIDLKVNQILLKPGCLCK